MELSPIMQKGLELPKPVYDQAILPPDITELSSEQLAEMFTILTGWADYMSSQLVQAQLAERDALRKTEFAESKALVRLTTGSPKGTTVSLIKAQIDVDPDIVELRDKYEEKYAYRKILEMMVNNQERDITLVSREITRRTNESRMGRRDTFIT
jgi:hypothetical protein